MQSVTPRAPRRSKSAGGRPSRPTVSMPRMQPEKQTLHYSGRVIRLTTDEVTLPNGHHALLEVVHHPGGAAVAAVDEEHRVCLLRQYRYVADGWIWELPAGKLEPGEDPLTGAQRELEEETGYRAKKWKPMVEYYASPGFLGESMLVFTAEGLIPGDAHPEDDEQIEIRLVKLSEVLKMIEKGAILDGKTLTSVLLYARLLAKKRK